MFKVLVLLLTTILFTNCFDVSAAYGNDGQQKLSIHGLTLNETLDSASNKIKSLGFDITFSGEYIIDDIKIGYAVVGEKETDTISESIRIKFLKEREVYNISYYVSYKKMQDIDYIAEFYIKKHGPFSDIRRNKIHNIINQIFGCWGNCKIITVKNALGVDMLDATTPNGMPFLQVVIQDRQTFTFDSGTGIHLDIIDPIKIIKAEELRDKAYNN